MPLAVILLLPLAPEAPGLCLLPGGHCHGHPSLLFPWAFTDWLGLGPPLFFSPYNMCLDSPNLPDHYLHDLSLHISFVPPALP